MGLLSACGDNKVVTGEDPIECNAPEQLCGTTCIDVTDNAQNCGSCFNACSGSEICLGGACVTKVECDATQTDCNNVCKETQTDEENCGSCGNKCTTGQVCIDGACEATVTCTSPQVNCNNDCVDTTNDEQNCGSCGNACTSSQTCVSGQCQTTVTCTLPQIACNNVCVDPSTDEAHCGGCDMPCTSAQTCTPNGAGTSGTCQTTTACTAPQINCDNTCVDPRTDEANCGGCGTACQPGQSCTPNGNSGTCQGTVSCTSPQVDCDNTCVNTQTDNNHCGACNAPCGGSTPDCCGGTCKDFDSDVANCGSCGNACASDQTCNSGTCTDICATGLELCNGVCIDPQTSNTDCGTCGNACSPPTTTCQSGSCTPTCQAPNMQCGPNCINTTNDNANCGACNNPCTGGKVCSNSTCGCPAGQMDCNGTCKDLQNDNANCGACGNPCATGLTCVSGTCQLVCPSGQTNCNGTCVDTTSDEAHCGNCTTTCDTNNFEQCINSLCDVTCSGSLPNECEGTCIDFANGTPGTGGITENCGGCGPAFDCPSGQACSNGSCVLSCGSGTTLCSGACVDFNTDENNCGGCGPGFECPANSTCNGGSCQCDAGTPNTCPGVCVNFQTDEGHCGNCATQCTGTQTCDDGKCCGVGTENCNGTCVDTGTSATNCGGCGITCDPGEVCDGGQCSCPFGQAVCPQNPGGGCQVTSNNPDACGPTCAVCSGQTPFCVSNGCAASCPAPLEACGNDCVNTNSDNNNCGACGTVCPAGMGCSDGDCVPKIVVGPDPAKCVNGGPPIVVPTEDGDTCTGSLGAVTFRFGLCSCTNLGPLSHDLTVDAFDSRIGPYDPTNTAKRMGGGIGVNRTMQNTARTEAFGEIWVFGSTVTHATKGPLISHSDFYNKGNFDFTALVSVDEPVLGRCSVDTNQKCLNIGNACPGTAGTCVAGGEDAFIGGTINKGSGGNYGMTVSGDLDSALTTCSILVGEDVIPNAVVRPQDCHNPAPFDQTIENPCDCTVSPDPNLNQIIPVRSIVAHFANPANNDNSLIGLSTQALVGGSGAQRLDLPCGNYYLDQINISNATTIVVHGRTGLYIGGSIIVSQPIIFDLDPDATLDIFVAGVVKTSQDLTLGNPAFPRLSRMYVGSAGCSGSGSCTQNADCCSGVCQAGGTCLGGAGGNVSESFSMSGNSFLNGLMYSGVGTFRVTNPLVMNGAVFANYYDSVEAQIHYDKGAVANGAECPPPDDCDSCQDCNNQACVNGQCGSCTDSSQCCSPLQCVNGTCVPLSVNQ